LEERRIVVAPFEIGVIIWKWNPSSLALHGLTARFVVD